jgi:hypothetical protein
MPAKGPVFYEYKGKKPFRAGRFPHTLSLSPKLGERAG